MISGKQFQQLSTKLGTLLISVSLFLWLAFFIFVAVNITEYTAILSYLSQSPELVERSRLLEWHSLLITTVLLLLLTAITSLFSIVYLSGSYRELQESTRFDQERQQQSGKQLVDDLAEAAEKNRKLEQRLENLLQEAAIRRGLLSNLIHEIGTEIHSIGGLCDFCLVGASNLQERRQYLHTISSAADKIHQTLRDIMDYEQLSQQQVKITAEKILLREFLQNLQTDIEARYSRNNLKFMVHVEDAVPVYMWVDNEKLGNVLKKLVDNAMKFTEQGVVTLLVSPFTQNSSEQPESLQFLICDTGSGFSLADAQQTFQPFNTVKEKVDVNSRGLGLGLNIVKEVLSLMDGTLYVQSEQGKGATIRVILPVYPEKLLADATSQSSTQVAIAPSVFAQQQMPFAGFSILLAEDNAVNRLVVEKMLNDFGARVDAVDDGLALMNKASLHHYDLILTDIQMPHMDGLASVAEIRNSALNANVPIMLMSADPDAVNQARDSEYPVDVVVAKPLNRQALFNAMAPLLSKLLQQNLGDSYRAG